MRKPNARWALAASVLCALQVGYVQGTVSASSLFSSKTPETYQSDLNSMTEAYPGELSGSNRIDTSTIRVVRRNSAEQVISDGLPTRIDADSMKYKGDNGDIDASGNVIIKKGNQVLRAPRVTGNVNTSEYTTSGGPYQFVEDGGVKNMTGETLSYQANQQAMQSSHVTGFSDPYYFKANNVSFQNGVGYIDKGMVTTKNAMAWKHTPDYRVEGKDITIYPGDKAIIKHPTFFIKNTRILSLPSYTVSLRHDKAGQFSLFSLIPRPMYDSDDGLGLKADVSIPNGRNAEWYAKYQLFSKVGFKPEIGYRRYLPWGEASIGYSKEDATVWDEKVWVEKIGELRADTHAYHIGDTPFTIRGGANAGYWREGDVKGAHYEYYTELSHDMLHPWKGANFYVFAGYQRDMYSYDHSIRSMPYWGARLSQSISPRLSAWAGYTQRNTNGYSPYPFDTVDIPKEINYGISWKATRLDDISLSIKQNAETGRIEDRNITYHRDLHSFDVYFTYKDVTNKWEMKWAARDF